MLTTLEIPDHILKHAKRRAVEEGCTLKEIIHQALKAELAAPTPADTAGDPAGWRVPVAPHDMGWNALDEAALQQILDTQREDILLHRGGISRARR